MSGDAVNGKLDALKTFSSAPIHVLLVMLIGGMLYLSYLDLQTSRATLNTFIEMLTKQQAEEKHAIDRAVEQAAHNLRFLVDAHGRQLDAILTTCAPRERDGNAAFLTDPYPHQSGR